MNAQVQLSVEGYGEYEASLAAFGINDPCNFPVIEADLVLIDDGTESHFGCVPYDDPKLEGQIAVIQRGSCNFWEKALNAQNNGAIAVVICNNRSGIRPMSVDRDGRSESIHIPTIMLSDRNCRDFILEIERENSVLGKITENLPKPIEFLEVIWGDEPGQGQFEDMNNWMVRICNIIYTRDTIYDELSWMRKENAIEDWFGTQLCSYSRCNGAVGYESTEWNINNTRLDVLDYPNHHCELISPIIDLSQSTVEYLQFFQINYSLNGNDNPADPVSRLFISFDGGLTWPEKYDINTKNRLTADSTNWAMTELKRLFIPHLSGEDSIRLKFEFFGDFYAWYIDDVYFLDNPMAKFNTQFYPYPTNAMTPCYLTEDILGVAESGYLYDSSDYAMEINLEGPESFNFQLEAQDPNGDAKYCGTNNIQPEEPGQYTIDMYMTENNEPVDSSRFRVQKNFRITDLVWSKDPGMVNEVIRPAADSGWVWGSVFTVPENYSGSAYILGAEFGFELADSIDGSTQFVSFEVLEWTDTNNDDMVQLEERSSLGGGFLEFSYRDGIDGEMNTYNFENLQTIDPIPLEAGKHYILAVTWQNSDRKLNMMGYTGLDYDGMKYMYRECLGKDRYVDVIGVGQSDINGTWSTAGWNSKTVPAMRLLLNRGSCVVNNEEIKAENLSLKLSPNPASDQISISLGETSTDRIQSLRVYDVSGQLQKQQIYKSMQSLPMTLKVNDWDPGLYYLQLQTGSGVHIGKFVVQR